MEIDAQHKVAILRALRDSTGTTGSREIAQYLRHDGITLSPRTVRLYLEIMEREGLVGRAKRGRKGGRALTSRGMDEIKDSLVVRRLGFTAARVDSLAWQMTFDLKTRKGLIVLNITTFDAGRTRQALAEMVPVFEARLGMGSHVLKAREGESIGGFVVPEGRMAIGTVCSVTINGIFLKAGIPTTSRFGGVLEIHDGRPLRFTDMIYYDGTSLDPLEIFIKGGLTSVSRAASSGNGRIGAGFREVPTAALDAVEKIRRDLRTIGLDGILIIGRPNQPLLDIPVHDGRTGVIVAGGLNPASAIEEAGIPTENSALSCLYEFENLVHFSELKSIVPSRRASKR